MTENNAKPINSQARGIDALTQNSMVVEATADELATTLGPKGMDKLILFQGSDKSTITNDGATIIQKLNIDNPISRMLVDIARTQDEEVGDGTTSSIVLTGALLKKAGELRKSPYNQHPQKIIDTYEIGIDEAIKYYKELSRKVKDEDIENIVKTTLTGKIAGKPKLFKDVAAALRNIDSKDTTFTCTIKGSSANEIETVKGFVIDKELIHKDMSKDKPVAHFLLINRELVVKVPDINMSDPSQLSTYMDQEELLSREIVSSIKKIGADVVLCNGMVSDIVKDYLTKERISCIKRVKMEDLEHISKITGASVVNSIKDLNPFQLGVGSFKVVNKYGEEYAKITNKNTKARTIIIRGTNNSFIEEMERSIEDAIKVVDSIKKSNLILTGAGSCELAVANKLRDYALKFEGIEQLIIQKLAEAIEIIPMSLATSSGSNQFETFLKARSQNKNNTNVGIDVMNGTAADMSEVIEPLLIKVQALNSAMEVTKSILRINNILLGRMDA